MKRLCVLMLAVIVVAGCSPSKSQIAAGEFNLSKGKCINIPYCKNNADDQNCKKVSDEMTHDYCQMLGGEFVPRDHKRLYWF